MLIGHNKPSDAVLITRTMKELAFNPVAYGGILGGHVSNEYVNALGKDADAVLCTTSWSADADIPGLKPLAAKYQERFKEHLDSTSAGGFTAFAVLWDSLERAGSADRKKLRDAVAAAQMKTGDRMYMQLTRRQVHADRREPHGRRHRVRDQGQGMVDGRAEGVREDRRRLSQAQVVSERP